MSFFRVLPASLAVVAVVGLASVVTAQIQGPVTISNESIRLTVNPSVGRVVDFGRVGGANLMRITDSSVLTSAKQERRGYQGYGGDQLWPAQQAKWGQIRGSGGSWPPLAELDGPNWTIVDQTNSHITIESPQTPLLGLVARRRFEISPKDSIVTITNTFERIKPLEKVADVPVQIWSVTGIKEPEFTLADVSPERPRESTFVALSSNPSRIVTAIGDNEAIRFDNRAHGPGESERSNAMKLGMYGDWLAAVYADDIFVQRSKYNPSGTYPDNAATEIYSSQTTGSEYLELEILSPASPLPTGESLSNTVEWRLLDRPNLGDEQLVKYIQSVPEPSSVMQLLCALWLGAVIARTKRQKGF